MRLYRVDSFTDDTYSVEYMWFSNKAVAFKYAKNWLKDNPDGGYEVYSIELDLRSKKAILGFLNFAQHALREMADKQSC